jgi:glycosyltransferase involved in cell wall biosynthesis
MKILYAHDHFGAFAGAESNILATANELARRGHTVGILHGDETGKGLEQWRETFDSRFAMDDSAIESALTTFQPDVIYVHKLAELDALEALLSSGIPLVRMVHDHDLYCMRSYKYNYFTRRPCERALSAFCLFPCGGFLARNQDGPSPVRWVSYSAKVKELELTRRFNRLIVGTRFMGEELLRNGFDAERIEIHAPTPALLDTSSVSSFSDRNLIVYSGQITRGKGVDVLLESLAQVAFPFECVIFGDGNHRAYCEKLCARLELNDCVHFKGYVPPEEIHDCYREASVVVMSSIWPEPFGAAGLEGMRFGLPVVAFDAGGIKEWLTDNFNGFLVPWMDRATFAARIEQLLRDKKLARGLGERGRQLIAGTFSFAKYVDGLENTLKRVAVKIEQPVIA